jgi:hypothetical protein
MSSRFEREILEILQGQPQHLPKRSIWTRFRLGLRRWWAGLGSGWRRAWDEAPWRTLDAANLMLWAFGLAVLGLLFRGVMSPLAYLMSLTGVLLFGISYLMAFFGFPPARPRRVRWRGRIVELPPEPNPWDRWKEWWRRTRRR